MLQQRLMTLQKARFVPVDYRPVAWTVGAAAARTTVASGTDGAIGSTTAAVSHVFVRRQNGAPSSSVVLAPTPAQPVAAEALAQAREAERHRRLDALGRAVRNHRAARIQRWWRRLRLAAEVERHSWVVQRLRHLHERALIIQHWWHAVCVRRQYVNRADRPPVTVSGLSAGSAMARARIDLALARSEGAALVNAVRPSAIQLWDAVLARRQ
jgi:hypothetical protein